MKSTSFFQIIFHIAWFFVIVSQPESVYAQAQKPRILITTDIGGDPDDTQSLIRYLLYANEFETEGIIASASGTIGELDSAIVQPQRILQLIGAYEKVYENLRLHDPSYPLPATLSAVVKAGNPHRGWENVGEGHDTEGSEWIIQAVDRKDKRPLNICIWGGQTDVAQALWKVKNTRSESAYKKFAAQIRIYDINDQDQIFSMMYAQFPQLFYILSKAQPGEDKREGGYRGMYLGGDESTTSREWIYQNIITAHGDLGALYPDKTWTAPNPHGTMKEGDTPSWFYFLDNGLNDPAHPEYGGWGGRFEKNAVGYYECVRDSVESPPSARTAVWRWRPDFQRDFAARADRCVQPFANTNHNPEVIVNGVSGNAPIIIRAGKKETILIEASESFDIDKNSLSFDWFFYHDCSRGYETSRLTSQGSIAEVSLPTSGKNYEIHLIVRVTDNGSPALCAYRRIIIRP